MRYYVFKILDRHRLVACGGYVLGRTLGDYANSRPFSGGCERQFVGVFDSIVSAEAAVAEIEAEALRNIHDRALLDVVEEMGL